MARETCIHFPGATYHVILCGNAGDPIFFDDRDRCRLYLFLQYAVEKFDCCIHAFCLMTTPLHLFMQVGDIPLSRIMQNVSLCYTKWINFAQSRTGHLFQGRYKALLLDADTYLLELVRYIHHNPVRAGMVTRRGLLPTSQEGPTRSLLLVGLPHRRERSIFTTVPSKAGFLETTVLPALS